MIYMGSKARFAKELLPIILKDRKEGQWYVEPFCGGCNMIDKVTGNRMACDNNPFLIAMWDGLINNKCFVPKTHIDKEYYSRMRKSITRIRAVKSCVLVKKQRLDGSVLWGLLMENSLGVIRDTMSVRGIIYLSK